MLRTKLLDFQRMQEECMLSFSAAWTRRGIDRDELTGARIEDGHGSLLCF